MPLRREISTITHTWVFLLKPSEVSGNEYLHKARCVVRRDLQSPVVDYDPGHLYGPVASHEAIRIILAIAAAEGLLVEGGDVFNAYLYGKMDIPILIDQPQTLPQQKSDRVMAVCLLESIYGTKQAGKSWGLSL